MQRMQRITGRFLTRTPNEADVEAMLHDFNDSKAMLEKVRMLQSDFSTSSWFPRVDTQTSGVVTKPLDLSYFSLSFAHINMTKRSAQAYLSPT